MKKCVIYARVSTDNQNTKSQIEVLQKWAVDNDFKVVKTFDESISGFIEDRDELLGLKNFIKENSIKQVICYELSRLGRSTFQTLKEIHYFSKEGVNVYFKKEQLNTLSTEPTNQLLLNLLSSISELEVSTLKDRMSRGRTSSVQKGKRTGYCFLPYGFGANNEGYLIINQKESNIVNEIFDMYINGKTMRRIAIDLNTRNIPTRHTTVGKKRIVENGDSYKILWRNNSIITILKNPVYKGERIYMNETIKVPQIVDSLKWDKVQNMLKDNIGYRSRTKYKYLFKTKIFCGHCGYMYGTRTEPRYHQPSFYFCNGKSDLTINCRAGQFSSKFIDSMLYEYIYSLDNSRIFSYFVDEYRNKINLEEKKIQKINLQTEIDLVESKKRRITTMRKEGYISDIEFKKDILKLINEKTDFENTIRQIEREISHYNEEDVKTIIRNAKKNIDFDTQYDYVQRYVDKVVIYSVESYVRDEFLRFSNVWNKAEKVGTSENADKLIYIELFAFGTKNPLKVVLSSWTKRYYIGKADVEYNIKDKSLALRPKRRLVPMS